MLRYQRIGCPEKLVHVGTCLNSLEHSLTVEETDDRPDITKSRRQDCVNTGNLVAIQFYLLDDLQNTRVWASKVLDYAAEYFFGDWRDRIPSGDYGNEPPNRDYWDRKATWRYEFQACLLWSSCLADWDGLRRFAAYLRDDVIRDVDQPNENRSWLLAVARVLQGTQLDQLAEYVAVIHQGTRKRERFLLAFLDAILNADDTALARATKDYFKYYKSSESKKQEITAKVAMDGTFLVNFARYRGRSIEVPANVQDHIVVL
jgi:hypothetical protein